MALQLLPDGDGPTIPLERPIVFIGRHPDCDVRIDSRKVSRRHCCLTQLKDKIVVRDLGSTNGIQHNGRRVKEAVLALQDEIVIGDLRYLLVEQNDNGESARTEPEVPPGGKPAEDH